MALNQITPDWKQVPTYATEANLMKRIREDQDLYPDHRDRYMVVRTPEGRWTAVVILDRSTGGYMARSAFMSV